MCNVYFSHKKTEIYANAVLKEFKHQWKYGTSGPERALIMQMQEKDIDKTLHTLPAINIIGFQSAISTDCDIAVSVNCYNGCFAQCGYRQNVLDTRTKMLALQIWPLPETPFTTSALEFKSAVIQQLGWTTDVTDLWTEPEELSLFPAPDIEKFERLCQVLKRSLLLCALFFCFCFKKYKRYISLFSVEILMSN